MEPIPIEVDDFMSKEEMDSEPLTMTQKGEIFRKAQMTFDLSYLADTFVLK